MLLDVHGHGRVLSQQVNNDRSDEGSSVVSLLVLTVTEVECKNYVRALSSPVFQDPYSSPSMQLPLEILQHRSQHRWFPSIVADRQFPCLQHKPVKSQTSSPYQQHSYPPLWSSIQVISTFGGGTPK